MHRSPVVSLAALLLVLALATPVPAPAVTLTWNNAVGGFAGNAVNWNPVRTPTAADSLVFPLVSTYPVTFGVQLDTSYAVTVVDGDVTFRYPTPHLMTGRLLISGPDPHAVQESGEWESRGPLLMANGIGARGWLQVRGAGTRATFSSTSLHVIGSTQADLGQLDAEHGGNVEFAGGVLVGGGLGEGELRVLGESAAPGAVRSRLALGLAAGVPTIGQAGTGRAEVRDGGLLETGAALRVGALTNGIGTLVVGGLGTLDSARVVVPGTLGVGVNSTAPSITRGTVRVQSGGVVEVGSATTVGDAATAGDDTLAIEPGGRFVTHGLTFADAATGLQFTGGLLQVIGGTLGMGDDALRLGGASAGQTLELLGGCDAVLDPATTPGLLVGGTAPAQMRVVDGSTVTLLRQNVRIADEASSIGDLTLDNGSSLVVAENLIVARDGIGSVVVEDGSSASVADLRAGTGAAGVGAFVLRGAGAQAHVSQQIELGGTSAAATGGIGVVGVEAGGSLWLDHPTDAGDIWPGCVLQVKAGGVATLAGALEVRGRVDLQGGSIGGGAVRLQAGGRIEGAGDLASRLGSAGDTTGRVVPGGALAVGRADATDGVDFDGTLDVGAQTITLRDADSARVAAAVLAGGKVMLPPGGGASVAGRAWSGTGTVSGPFRPRGLVVATGATGLRFEGLLEGTGQGVNGSRLEFLPGGGFSGSGALKASVQVDSGATITSTGNLTLGAAPAASTVRVDGALQTGAHTLTFAATDTVRLAGTWTLGNTTGASSGGQQLLVLPSGSLSGRGTHGAIVVVDGTLDPGPDVGRVQANGFRLRAGSHYRAGLGSFAAGRHDTLVSAGTFFLGGSLDLVRLPDFVANPGDTFQVISAPSVSGAFSGVTLDGQTTIGQVGIVYRPGGVWVRLLAGIVDAPSAPRAAAADLRLSALGSPGRSPSLELALPAAAHVQVSLYDLAGRHVATLHDGPLGPGLHRLGLAREGRRAGLYFVRALVAAGGREDARGARVLLLD